MVVVSDAAALFLEKSRSLLVSDYLPKIDSAVAALNDQDLWWRPNEVSNADGNLMLHLAGNMSQWLLDGVGGRKYVRHRQREFDERGPIPRQDLVNSLHRVVTSGADVISSQTGASLCERRRIQGYDVTVLEAIYHVVEHFGIHTGQIIMIAKLRAARDLQLWEPPPA
jgi:hypothetical protein